MLIRAAISLAVFSGTIFLSAQEADQTRIASLESAWNQAVLLKDAKAVDTLLASELIFIDYDGSVKSKSEYLESIKAAQQQLNHISLQSVSVQVYGRSALATGIYSESGATKGKPFKHDERFVDTWIHRNGMWVCVASQSTLIKH